MSRPRMHHIDKVGAFLSREALHEKVVAFAEAEFDRRGQCPFIWAIYDGNDIIWIETPWEDDREKYGSIRAIRALLKVANARAYSNAVEAWVASYKADKDGKFPEEHVMPSKLPENERDDVLMITTFDKGGGWQGTRYKVTVRKGRGYNFLGPRDDQSFETEGGHFEGVMFNLFKDESS